MGRFFQRYYNEDEAIYRCSGCGAHFALYKDLLSTNFRGRTGNALLFNQVVNVTAGPLEDSVMTTGLHTIRCLYCVVCQERVGWKYEVAFEEDQKYKEGRFILEEELISTGLVEPEESY
uniref:Protein yippee-like n=1 Tax=Alexandrium andersonii TaxID=327968 RepID=A0A7S2G344_9DINO|mmetsp:Transcript_40800/g.92690  ORF Transcript_40800/g.92690 Transcript_40800/m.92690 type:complete len:119 (+) Transcript_40800:66-422(+)